VIADRKPWKAPRLIPIDDTDTDGKNSDSQEGTRNGRMIFWKKDPDPAS